MPLESLSDQQRDISIKNLALPEVKKEVQVHFDPERDLTQEDWAAMTHILENTPIDNEHREFALLAPKKVPRLDPNQARILAQRIDQNREDSTVVLPNALSLKILFPDYYKNNHLTDTNWRLVQNDIKDKQQRNILLHNTLQSAKFLSPKTFNRLNLLEGTSYEKIEEMKNNFSQLELYYFIHLAAASRILFPDKFNKRERDSWDWTSILQNLKLLIHEDVHRGITQALKMKLLAADEINITEDDIQINMYPPKAFVHDTRDLPKQRSF